MTQRDRKRLLWAVNAALAAALAASLASAFWPLRGGQAGSLPSAERDKAGTPQRPAAQTLEDYAVIGRRDLRAPLFDTPPATLAPKPPMLNVELTGTSVEGANSLAMFRTPDGQIKIAGVGQAIDGAKVVEIKAHSVILRFGSQLIELNVVQDIPQDKEPSLQ
jgi:hypothetical protein